MIWYYIGLEYYSVLQCSSLQKCKGMLLPEIELSQPFTKDKSIAKHQNADSIQPLKVTCLYISRGSYTVILNNIQDLYNIISFILSSKLHTNIYPIHLRELQSSNELEGVSDKFMIISVFCDSITYLHITYIICINDVLVTLQPFTFYMYISHNPT